MPELLPKWLMKRYLILWKYFDYREFSFAEATKVLKSDDERIVNLCLATLNKMGWVKSKKHPIENRKKIYMLEKLIDNLKQIANECDLDAK